jgi:UDP-N-acetylmuramoyl-L-alanyl-D-glutamate--2,6-diaminopimelate ligase
LKTLTEILVNCYTIEIFGATDIPIANISYNSKDVSKGSLFIAVKGSRTDGHHFIDGAISSGALAVVCENFPESKLNNITYIKVDDCNLALGILAANFYDNPSEELKLVGVTGTNGKTTVATLLYELFTKLGYKTGLFSTVCNKICGTVMPATHTTPDPVMLNSLLRRMADEGCSFVFMEVSSHAIDQKRIAGLTYSGGVFTNLTHDHLDYHLTFDNYLKAKKTFFDNLKPDSFALTNVDDRNGLVMIQNTKARKHTYSLQTIADFKCKVIENQFSGLQLNIDGIDAWFKLVGNFNAYNILAIYGTAVLLEQDRTEVLSVLSDINAVEGRFDYIRNEENITAIVDYAHTPDALKNILSTVNSIRTGEEKLITVFGAGGDRDRTKRPEMAKIACELSDKVIVTSDNPRTEEPEDIILDILKGVDIIYKRKVLTIENRSEAIKTACSLAAKNDIIVVAGKGHEKYQEINGVKHPFDDKEILKEYLLNK